MGLVCITQDDLQGGEDVADGWVACKAPEAAASQGPHAERVEAACATAAVWPPAQQREQHLKARRCKSYELLCGKEDIHTVSTEQRDLCLASHSGPCHLQHTLIPLAARMDPRQ